MSTATFPTSTVLEIDQRYNDGVTVTWFWERESGRHFFSVKDEKNSDAFVLDAPQGAEPLDVFHHPFSYQANATAREPVLQSESDEGWDDQGTYLSQENFD